MFCDRCGTRVTDVYSFCPKCGKGLCQTPLMPTASRVAGHSRLLGILWLAYSAVRLIPGLGLLSVSSHVFDFLPHHLPGIAHGIFQAGGAFLVISGILGLAAGWGLLEREPWARTLALVLGFLSLFKVPVGTALGIYTLWVLLPAQSEQEYRRLARAA